ncbi:hypothetical protein ACFZCP_35155 [Streptomyces sp. NPDC007971]|uniref:hypothetical protein n=1 Tax=Streptomyces sp. NPDC007971 TaxID=3364799 RepID=UPI0036E9E835
MRRTVLPIAAILLTAACSSGTSTTASKPTHTPTPRATQSSRPAAAPSHSASHTTKPKPKPSRSKGCGPERDVIVWYRTPGGDDSAQVIGNYNVVSCQTTFDELRKDSPTGDGYCTEAAWADENPGYNADATVAKRLKNVQVSVGPAC